MTYFGFCDAFGVGIGVENIGTAHQLGRIAAGFPCPGVGDQVIQELGIELVWLGWSDNIRMGLYDLSGHLIVETSTKLPTSGGWLTWDDTELTWHVGTTLNGGQTYVIAFADASGLTFKGSTGGVYGDWHFNIEDDSGGLPDPEPVGNDSSFLINVRCGVFEYVPPIQTEDSFGATKIVEVQKVEDPLIVEGGVIVDPEITKTRLPGVPVMLGRGVQDG